MALIQVGNSMRHHLGAWTSLSNFEELELERAEEVRLERVRRKKKMRKTLYTLSILSCMGLIIYGGCWYFLHVPPAPDNIVRLGNDKLHFNVANLPHDVGGWIDSLTIKVDEDHSIWVEATASVRKNENKRNGYGYVYVIKSEEGLKVIFYEEVDFPLNDLSSLRKHGQVIPVTSIEYK